MAASAPRQAGTRRAAHDRAPSSRAPEPPSLDGVDAAITSVRWLVEGGLRDRGVDLRLFDRQRELSTVGKLRLDLVRDDGAPGRSIPAKTGRRRPDQQVDHLGWRQGDSQQSLEV